MTSSSNAQTSDESTLISNLSTIVTICGGITGILFAIAWLLGRISSEFYLRSMNISPSQIDMSVYQTVRAGTFPTILVLVIPVLFNIYHRWMSIVFGQVIRLLNIKWKVALCLLLVLFANYIESLWPDGPEYAVFSLLTVPIIIMYPAFEIFRDVSERLIKRSGVDKIPLVQQKTEKKGNRWHFPSVSTIIQYVVIGFLVLWIVVSLEVIFQNRWGRLTVIENKLQVQLVTNEQLLPDVVSTTTTTGTDTAFVYDGLRLLFYNDKRYFLFRMVNANCTPEQIYIVKEDDLKAVRISPASQLAPDCKPQGSLSLQATPIVTTTPMPPTMQTTITAPTMTPPATPSP